MDTRTYSTRFGPGRIVALGLIALALAGLAYLRFSGESTVSVPSGAHAGQLTLHQCTTYRGLAADCGTLVVPENRHEAHSRLIALPVTRIHARTAATREPVFRLQGGPGLTNMHFPDASRFAGDRDVVLVGYRGVDGSSVLDCPEADSAIRHARDLLGSAYFTAYAQGLAPVRIGSAPRRRPRPVTRCPSASTTSRPPGARSATAASTCSARVPARAPR